MRNRSLTKDELSRIALDACGRQRRRILNHRKKTIPTFSTNPLE